MQSVFEILDTMIGMVLFAGIMGSIGDLVAKANKVKADWQQRMDGLKQFMTYRLVHILKIGFSTMQVLPWLSKK